MDTGIATSLDVLQAEVGVANATDRLLRAEKALEDAKDRFITVIGDETLQERPLNVEAPDVEDPIEPDVESTFNRVIENAPRYLTLLNQRHQREIELRRAKRNRLPSLNLIGDYALTGLEGSLEAPMMMSPKLTAITGSGLYPSTFPGGSMKGGPIT